MSFRIVEPKTTETPVVVEIPHAGLKIDPLVLATLSASARSVGLDADLYVDELYVDAPLFGATMLIAEMSRYVCDLNRAESDVDAGAVNGASNSTFPHGLIWRLTTESRPALSQPISEVEYQRRLREYYRPYHNALHALLLRKQQRFGYVIVLAGHSMPSSGRAGHADAGARRADVVPGSRGRTSADPAVIECPDRVAKARGWSVAHDQPYRGGFTTGFYGRPSDAVHVVQIELNRALYMNETTFERVEPGFSETRRYCSDVVRELSQIELSATRKAQSAKHSRA